MAPRPHHTHTHTHTQPKDSAAFKNNSHTGGSHWNGWEREEESGRERERERERTFETAVREKARVRDSVVNATVISTQRLTVHTNQSFMVTVLVEGMFNVYMCP